MFRAQTIPLFLAAFLLLPSDSSANTKYSGTVVADGKPVDGAKVWLCCYHRLWGNKEEVFVETKTDSQGRFTLASPKAPDQIPYDIIARAADGRIGRFSLVRNDQADSSIPRIELSPVGDAQGRLMDAAGKPLADVRLRVRSFGIRQKETPKQKSWETIPNPLSSHFEATTGADGSFVLHGILLGAEVHATVSAPRYGNPDIFWGRDRPGEFRLERAGRVRIHFTGAAKLQQLAGLPMNLFTRPASDANDGQPMTNSFRELKAKDQATLDVADVLPGRAELRFYGAAEAPYIPTKLPEFTVKPGELTEVTVPVELAVHVRGRAIDRQSKKGIAGLRFAATSQGEGGRDGSRPWSWVPFKSDAEGRFSAYVRAGRIGLQIWQYPDGYAPSNTRKELVKPVQLAGGAEHTFPDIALEPAVVVEGLVVDDSGKPVPGAQIRTTEDIGRSSQGRIMTDEQGKFTLRNLGSEDVFALRVRSERAATDGGIVVKVAEQRGPVRLVLSEKTACRLKGRVVDNLGKPVAGAAVGIGWHFRGVGRYDRMGLNRGLGSVKTDAEGRFASAVLWPGDSYRVTVKAEGHGTAQSVEIKGKAGEVHDLGAILLPRTSGQIRGVIVDAGGQPLAGVNVFNRTDAPQPVEVLTDKTGRFHLSGLFDGPILVFARKQGYRFTMARAETGAAEPRIVLPKAGTVPPSEAQPGQAKRRRQAEQKLLRHLMDKVLAMPEAKIGGYKHYVFECLAQADVAKAQKWLEQAKANHGLGANDVRRYSRTVRKNQAEQEAAKDADEAISLLSDLDAEDACTELRKLAERFQETEPARGLRFAEEAVVRARAIPLPRRIWSLGRVGDLVVRLGQPQSGTKLLKEAADLAEKLGTQGMHEVARGEAARLLAPYDLARACRLIQPMKDTNSTNRWLSEMAGHLARTDPKSALALVGEIKGDGTYYRQGTKLVIARQAAVHDPAEGARIASTISDVRYRAEALVHVATAVAEQDRKLAWSLLDQALDLYLDQPEPFRSWSNFGGRAVFAAWTAAQANALEYPDPAGAVARALACQLSGNEAHSPVHALEIKVRMAKVLALVDPATARHLLERVAPQQAVLGTGYSGFEKQDWLLARCLADPERGPALVDEAIAKLDPKENMAFYHSGLMQLAEVLSAPPARRVRLVMGLNSGLNFRNEE